MIKIEESKKIEQELNLLMEQEKAKLIQSIEEKINLNTHRGISQLIGRRYGDIWEKIVDIILKNSNNIKLKDRVYYKDYLEIWLEKNIAKLDKECCKCSSKKIISQFLKENTGIKTQDLCDFSFKYKNQLYAIDTKYRFNSNDSKTVREIANSGIHLKYMNYIPVLLLRTNRLESQETAISRFEKCGWKIIDDKKATDFLKEITGYNIEKWINKNLNLWKFLSKYQKELKKLGFGEEEWTY